MRIRTIKPEFWEDEIVGVLTREARILFLASLNAADDEGLLRWSPAYLKATAFIFDEDITVEKVGSYMLELEASDMVFPYIGGTAKQRLAFIVNFRKHQCINRPQPSKLPPPSLQSQPAADMYGHRDKWLCYLCGGEVGRHPNDADSLKATLDHVVPQSKGGGNYPSNIRLAHSGCNKGKCDKPVSEFKTPLRVIGLRESHPPRAMNDSLNNSLQEGNGREGKGRELTACDEAETAPPSAPAASAPEPIVLTYPVVGKGPDTWGLKASVVAEHRKAFPALDVMGELNKARGWCISNKSNRKTAKGMESFLYKWLARAQNDNRPLFRQPAGPRFTPEQRAAQERRAVANRDPGLPPMNVPKHEVPI